MDIQHGETMHSDTQYKDTQWCDTRHNVIQHNDTQYSKTKYYDTEHNGIEHSKTQHDDIQHNGTQHNDKKDLNIIRLNCCDECRLFIVKPMSSADCHSVEGHYAECQEVSFPYAEFPNYCTSLC